MTLSRHENGAGATPTCCRRRRRGGGGAQLYFKGDEANQWKRPKFDPSPHQNPLTDLHKNWQA